VSLEEKDLPCTYLAHHEPERVIVVVILNFEDRPVAIKAETSWF